MAQITLGGAQTLALLTVTYNDRPTLPLVVHNFLEYTAMPQGITWIMVMQNCSDTVVDKIRALCKDRIRLILIRLKQNVGLSKALDMAVAVAKPYTFCLMIEDDWVLLPGEIKTKNWLAEALAFMMMNEHVSTVHLRAYDNDKEKYQYGWHRTIPYRCHKFKDNFNYAIKILEAGVTIPFTENSTMRKIPHYLYSNNPNLFRNADYWRVGVFPLQTFDNDQKDASKNANWGNQEALAQEKTRDLTTFWLNRGVFGHYEDLTVKPDLI